MIEAEAFRVFYGDAVRNMGWNDVEVFVRERNFSFVEVRGTGLRVFRPEPNRYAEGGRHPRQEPWSVGVVRLPKRDVDEFDRLLTEQERLQLIAKHYLQVDDHLVPAATWRTENKAAGEWVAYLLSSRGIQSKTADSSGESTALVEAADLAEARGTLQFGRAERLRSPVAKSADLDFKIASSVTAK